MAHSVTGMARRRVLETRSLETVVACPTCGGAVQPCETVLAAECRHCHQRVPLTEALAQ